MKATISANGKTIQGEISEEQAKILGLIEERSRTGYERVKKGDVYYVVNTEDDSMLNITEFNDQKDEQCYNTGNYYSDETIAENNARADRLLRHLRRWQAAHDQTISVSDWKKDIYKYSIAYNYSLDMPFAKIDSCCRNLNNVYFTTEDKTIEAIQQFVSDIRWYFTEYIQRLDEMKND